MTAGCPVGRERMEVKTTLLELRPDPGKSPA
jgi:hypothetical protein